LGTGFKNVFDSIKVALSGFIQSIKTSIVNQFNTVKTAVGNIINAIKNISKGAVTGLIDGFNKMKTIIQSVKSVGESMGRGIEAGLKSVARGVRNAIDWVQRMRDKLTNLKIPDWLTPGSPTPLEMGLIGISKSMRNLSTVELPSLTHNINMLPVTTGIEQSKKDDPVAFLKQNYPTAKDIGRAVAEALMRTGVSQ
jgi:hypothetical protein